MENSHVLRKVKEINMIAIVSVLVSLVTTVTYGSIPCVILEEEVIDISSDVEYSWGGTDVW